MSTYEFKKESEDLTIVVARADDKEIPVLWATIVRRDSSFYNITIRLGEDGLLLATASVFRGGAFASEVTRKMLSGCLSRLGKHRRQTANRAAKKEGK